MINFMGRNFGLSYASVSGRGSVYSLDMVRKVGQGNPLEGVDKSRNTLFYFTTRICRPSITTIVEMLQRCTEIKKFVLFGEADKCFEQLILFLVRQAFFVPVVVVQSMASLFQLCLVARLDSLAIS